MKLSFYQIKVNNNKNLSTNVLNTILLARYSNLKNIMKVFMHSYYML